MREPATTEGDGEGGFLEAIEHFEGRRTIISIAKGVELDERNPPLQKETERAGFLKQ